MSVTKQLKINGKAHTNEMVFGGFIYKDPEVKHLGDDKKVVNFTVIVKRKYEKKDGTEAETNPFFANCKAFGKMADALAHHLKDGDLVRVVVDPNNETWDKGDGTKGYKTTFTARFVDIKWRKDVDLNAYAKENGIEVVENQQTVSMSEEDLNNAI